MQPSLFHELQRDGIRKIRMMDETTVIEPPKGYFSFILSSSTQRPFPVTIIQHDELAKLGSAMWLRQGLAELHEVIDTAEDGDAFRDLWYETVSDTQYPARQFGIELHQEDAIVGYAFRFDGAPANATPRLHEADDLNMFMFFQYKDEPVELARIGFSIMAEHDGVFRFKTSYSHLLDKSHPMSPAKTKAKADDVGRLTLPILSLYHLLDLDPLLFTQETQPFAKENRLQKLRGKAALSPITTVEIDTEELRRRETVQRDDMAKTLREKGSYSIPGLQLVRQHERKSTGATVQAFAKCADEMVRKQATAILQADPQLERPETVDELAVLVRAFGAERTKARFGFSPVQQVKLVGPR